MDTSRSERFGVMAAQIGQGLTSFRQTLIGFVKLCFAYFVQSRNHPSDDRLAFWRQIHVIQHFWLNPRSQLWPLGAEITDITHGQTRARIKGIGLGNHYLQGQWTQLRIKMHCLSSLD